MATVWIGRCERKAITSASSLALSGATLTEGATFVGAFALGTFVLDVCNMAFLLSARGDDFTDELVTQVI